MIREPEPAGSIVSVALGRIGPSTPRADHVCGGRLSTISWVMLRSARPIRRVVVNRSPSARTLTTSRCHSGNRVTSVRYANASSGGTAISTVDTMALTNGDWRL